MSKKTMHLCFCVLMVGLASHASAGLVLHWGLNESAGTSAFDSVGDNHGTLIGNTAWDTAGGQFGGAAQFDGTDDSIRLTAETGPFPVSEYPFTLIGWCKSTKGSAKAIIVTIVQAPFEYYWIGLNNGRATITARSPSGMYEQSGGSSIADDQWHHVCGVFNGPEDRVLYLDGVEVATDDRSTEFLAGIRQVAAGALDRDPAGENIVDEMLGSVDDVAIYSEALDIDTINHLMIHGVPTLSGVSSRPSPAGGDTDVPRAVVLNWNPGKFAATHNVYFSDVYEDVNNGTALVSETQDANSYQPGALQFGTSYYWRVDEVNGTPDKTVFKGAVWSFVSEPYSIPIPGDTIVATASSSSNDFSTPETTINGSGLQGDAHAITAETMWFSASPDLDPWIQYEFDDVKKLDVMKVWNSNSGAEMAIGWGIKDVRIEYSVDGETWDVLESATQFSRGSGSPAYTEYDEIAFGGVAARTVRLNIQSNWGGLLMAYGLSEVQFSMIPAQAKSPEPASGSVDVLPNAVVTWRAGREAAQHTIYLSTDPEAVADGSAPSVTSSTPSLDLSSLDLRLGETYYWRVDEVNETEATSVWAGPVWNFSLVDALTVDDFERYSNASPDRPFQAWLDGFGYSADEFFPAGYGGNGTGAGIGHDIWSLSSPYYDGQIMETVSTVTGSGQSMPFYYSNTGGVASQTERRFTVPQNWTVGGVQTLSIAFRGQSGNTGTLYVIINETKVPYQRDPDNIAMGVWQAWNIDLSSVGVSLESITKLVIGVEGSGAAGMLLVDDIKLHVGLSEVITPLDPGQDGLVALYTFEGNANDVSGHGHDGTLNGTPQFVTGHDGSALACDGIDDYVSTGKTASDLGIGGNSPRTVSAWVLTRSYNNGGIYDVGARVASQDFCLRTLATENLWRVQYWSGDSDFTFDTTDKWVHFTHTHDGVNTRIYANGMLIVDWEKTIDTPDTNPFQIGCYGWQNDYFDGLIDELHVYDRALSAGEALWLAGRTAPVDKPF